MATQRCFFKPVHQIATASLLSRLSRMPSLRCCTLGRTDNFLHHRAYKARPLRCGDIACIFLSGLVFVVRSNDISTGPALFFTKLAIWMKSRRICFGILAASSGSSVLFNRSCHPKGFSMYANFGYFLRFPCNDMRTLLTKTARVAWSRI